MIRVLKAQVIGNLIPVSVVKNYLKIDQDVLEDDELISSLILSAYRLFDIYTGIAPTLTLYECEGYSTTNKEEVPRIPVVEIINPSSSELTLLDDGKLQVPVNEKYWFTLKAGYDDTPEEMKEVLLRVVAELYTKRPEASEISALFRPFRRRLL